VWMRLTLGERQKKFVVHPLLARVCILPLSRPLPAGDLDHISIPTRM